MWRLDICILTIAILILVSGCNGCDRRLDHAPRLSEREVMLIAEESARRNGYELANYSITTFEYEYVERDCHWTIVFNGKSDIIGNHFLVSIDDRTGTARVAGGL